MIFSIIYQMCIMLAVAIKLGSTAVPVEKKTTLLCANYIAPEIKIVNQTDTQDDGVSDDYADDEKDTSEIAVHQQLEAPGITECRNKNDVCFTFWKINQNGSFAIKYQGCWLDSSVQTSCDDKQCINKQRNSTHRFCCCKTNMCNQNITIKNNEIVENNTYGIHINLSPTSLSNNTILEAHILWLIVFFITLPMLASILYIIVHNRKNRNKPELSPLVPSGPGYSSNSHNVDNLKLCSMIGQGKYGTVWKGAINQQQVAVKIFPAQHKQYFQNEKEIYLTNLMQHPNILDYYGCDERSTMDDNIEYLLVLSLAPYGCLQDWLKENTTSFDMFISMALSVTRGLAHLHAELVQGDLKKPCICHRDLNSKNVLVKADLTCCIADFGFALKTMGPRYEWKGELTLAETKSINEILEGAVNLRDCESALKQVDIYSLGLILWELCTRCYDWYSNSEMLPEYKAPYEEEVGKNPSFEQMQILVSRHKTRPQFPSGWGGGLVSKIAQETCEDCWDADAEARLTALCTEERILEMSAMRPRTTHIPVESNVLLKPTLVHRQISPSSYTCHELTYQNNVVGMTKPPNQQIASEDFMNCDKLPQPVPTFQSNQCIERNLVPPNSTAKSLDHKNIRINFVQDKTNYTHLENETSVEELLTNFIRNDINTKNTSGQSQSSDSSTRERMADKKLKGWHGIHAMIQKKLFNRYPLQHPEQYEKTNLIHSDNLRGQHSVNPRTEPTLLIRPNNLQLSHTNTSNLPSEELHNQLAANAGISNVTSSDVEHEKLPNQNKHTFKKPPGNSKEEFAVIVENRYGATNHREHIEPHIKISKSANAVKNLQNSDANDEWQLKRQRSLEVFRDVFGAKGSIERLRDPSQRIKTPGDVPFSVRKVRASKTSSLYDDRMMVNTQNLSTGTI